MLKLKILFFISFVLTACNKPLWIKDAINTTNVSSNYFNNSNSLNISVNIDSIKQIYKLDLHGEAIKPLFYSHYLFIPTLAGRIYSYDLTKRKITGKLKFKGEIKSPLTLFNSRIIFAVNQLNKPFVSVILYDFKQKQIVNKLTIPASVNAKIIRYKQHYYLLNTSGTLFAINLIGTVDWKFNFNHKSISNLLQRNKHIFIFTDDGYLIKFNLIKKNIELIKKISNGFRNNSTSNGTLIFVTSNTNKLFCLDLNGNILWKKELKFPSGTDILCGNNYLIVSLINGTIELRKINNGDIIWSKNYGGVFRQTPFLMNNLLIEFNLNGEMLFINPDNGKLEKFIKFAHRLKGGNGTNKKLIFFGTETGEYYGYKLK